MDRAHDAFCALAGELQRGREIDDAGAWLYRAAVNSCLMELRRERVRVKASGAVRRLWSKTRSLEGDAARRRDVAALERALESLPLKQRAVFVLVHIEQKTQTEAAAILSLSNAQISRLRARALATLRNREWETADD